VLNLVSYLNKNHLKNFKDNIYQRLNSNLYYNSIVLGAASASKLNLRAIDTVSITSVEMLKASLQTMKIPSFVPVINTGIFSANIKEYDLTLAFTNPETINKLYTSTNKKISYIDIILNKNKELYLVKDKLSKLLGENIEVLTWIDLNKELYYVMQFERLAVFSILGLILLIAIFNVFASLAMTVIEKKQNIAILKSLGATNKFIRNIYIKIGITIGLLGTFSGFVLGIFIVFIQNNFHIFEIDADKYIIDKIPMVMNLTEVAVVCLFSILLSVLSTIAPAKKAEVLSIPQSILNE